jgi:hypothetical protein
MDRWHHDVGGCSKTRYSVVYSSQCTVILCKAISVVVHNSNNNNNNNNNEMRRVTQNRKEYNIPRQDWERF